MGRPLTQLPRRRSRVDVIVNTIGIIGRLFVVAGVLLLFFTAYLLWGTGVYTKQQQGHFKEQLGANPLVSDKDVAAGDIPPARPKNAVPLGEPLFSIKVPKIGLDTIVVNGVRVDDLKKGPGLFPPCKPGENSDTCVRDAKFPGEKGNVAISGHRTTYGAPFFRVNELKKGDVIDLVSGRARYRYRVREQKIVLPGPGFAEVEQTPEGRAELTLTSCHPRFSAAQRLIIKADYEGASLVAVDALGPGPTRAKAPPVIPFDVLVLGSIAIACSLGSLALSKRYRWAAAYIALGIVGASGLWVGVFPRVLSLLPENF